MSVSSPVAVREGVSLQLHGRSYTFGHGRHGNAAETTQEESVAVGHKASHLHEQAHSRRIVLADAFAFVYVRVFGGGYIF